VVIKEVIKEVPVEKVVTKIEYISDKTSENELYGKIVQLENEKQEFSTKLQECNSELVIFSTKTQKNENIFQDRIKELESREPEIIEIIKEVVVEKTTTDNSKQKALEETIQKIRTELQLKNKEINDLKNTITDIQTSNGRQGIFLDGSNLNRTINNRK
jgi:DNA repair exonuclease SbcCD ATPase subunit